MNTRAMLTAILADIDAAPGAGDPTVQLATRPALVYRADYLALTALLRAHGHPDFWHAELLKDFAINGEPYTRLTWADRPWGGSIEAIVSPRITGLTATRDPWGDPLPDGWQPKPPTPVRVTSRDDDRRADDMAEREHGPGRWEQ